MDFPIWLDTLTDLMWLDAVGYLNEFRGMFRVSILAKHINT